jgi:hypothetical protein
MLTRDPTCKAQRVPEWKLYKHRVGYFGKIYDDQVAKSEDMLHYERLSKEHDARQPYIKEDIMDALKMVHNGLSYRVLTIGVPLILSKPGYAHILRTTSALRI